MSTISALPSEALTKVLSVAAYLVKEAFEAKSERDIVRGRALDGAIGIIARAGKEILPDFKKEIRK